MTMVKVWFRLGSEVEEVYTEVVEDEIREGLKEVEAVTDVKLLKRIYNRDVGYFGEQPIGFVEVHIAHRQEVVDYLIEKISAKPLFIW